MFPVKMPVADYAASGRVGNACRVFGLNP